MIYLTGDDGVLFGPVTLPIVPGLGVQLPANAITLDGPLAEPILKHVWALVDGTIVQILDPSTPSGRSEAQVLAARDALLRDAALRVAPLQDAVDLAKATASERSVLAKWKNYRMLLGRIEQQPGFPLSVVWPEQPAQVSTQ